MQRVIKLGLMGLVAIFAIAYVYLNYFAPEASTTLKPLTQLEKTGDDCTLIAEKAAMHLPVALPFQRLEKMARQARVMETCMTDRGYIENPNWVRINQMQAELDAIKQHVSVSEAYESLRRTAIYQQSAQGKSPLYWVQKPSQ